jgi:hypothetical protein
VRGQACLGRQELAPPKRRQRRPIRPRAGLEAPPVLAECRTVLASKARPPPLSLVESAVVVCERQRDKLAITIPLISRMSTTINPKKITGKSQVKPGTGRARVKIGVLFRLAVIEKNTDKISVILLFKVTVFYTSNT